MDPMQAVNLLDQIVLQVPMNRQQHTEALRAVALLRGTLAPQPGESKDQQ